MFFCFVFLVLNLFYSLQRGSNGFTAEKTIIFQGSNIFQWGGVQLFPGRGGVQMLILIETHITSDFPGGGGGSGPPIPPLWIRTCNKRVQPHISVCPVLCFSFIKGWSARHCACCLSFIYRKPRWIQRGSKWFAQTPVWDKIIVFSWRIFRKSGKLINN